MNEKKSFILHCDSLSVIDKMSDAQVGQLFRKMKAYNNGDDYETSDFVVDIAFEQFKNQFDREKKKWEKTKEVRSEAGKLGGRPKKQNKAKKANALGEKQNKAKKAVSVSVNDNDNVNDNVKDNKKEILPIGSVNDGLEKKEYGNADINKCIDIISEHNNGIIDGTFTKNRNFSKHLINKIKKTISVKSEKFTRQEYLIGLLESVKGNKYYASKTNSAENIYKNLAILQGVANNKHKEESETVIQNFNFKAL